ncbi:hypothetical protein SAMN05518683_1541, partial [Salibacterium halotolerans]
GAAKLLSWVYARMDKMNAASALLVFVL